MSLLKRFDASVDNLAGKFAALVGDAPDQGATFAGQVQQGGPANTFGALSQQGGSAGSMWGGLTGQGTGGGFSFGGLAGRDRAPFDMSWLSNLRDVRAGIQADIQAKNGPGTATTASTVGAGGGPSAGLAPNVAKWASKAQQAFDGLIDPDVMLAIMTNESGGDPGAYNKAGNAYGLFQQLGFGDGDPNWASNVDGQFQAARRLAQDKLAGINAAYAKNGLNPDQRTRALDFALAWAGHFNYTTGRMDPTSVDNLVGGQTAQQFADIFLGNYDKIKAGRQQASAPAGGSGIATMLGGAAPSVMQRFGVTDYSEAHPATYAYGNAYGLKGSQHPGIDYGMALGSKLYSPVGGQVVYAGGTGYYTDTMSGVDPNTSGEYMVQMDNGDQIIVGHMQRINVNAGQRVNAGDFIGLSGGSDGAHAHLEVRQKQADGSYRIVDPDWYFGGR